MQTHIKSVMACLVIGLMASPLTHATSTQWHAVVGAQNGDMGHQAMAFLPNEIWVHAGDSVTWKFPTNEIHTVSFLIANEVRPPFPVGCPPGPPPGVSSNGTSFDGSKCVNTGVLAGGQSFTVKFPTAGNYKLVCLVHESMTGVVHVLPLSKPLPHSQAFYDGEARLMASNILALADADGDSNRILVTSSTGFGRQVIAGAGRIVATPGGQSTMSIMRFMSPSIKIPVGGTVEWGNDDPVTPHTITFGTEPLDDVAPSPNVSPDKDGALHAVISSPADSVHSGLISASGHERLFVPQAPLGVSRFRVTFTHAGVYPYICALHDGLGMKGTVVVGP